MHAWPCATYHLLLSQTSDGRSRHDCDPDHSSRTSRDECTVTRTSCMTTTRLSLRACGESGCACCCPTVYAIVGTGTAVLPSTRLCLCVLGTCNPLARHSSSSVATATETIQTAVMGRIFGTRPWRCRGEDAMTPLGGLRSTMCNPLIRDTRNRTAPGSTERRAQTLQQEQQRCCNLDSHCLRSPPLR